MAPVVTMKQLLESGVHFGHQTRRWNPKMKRYIFTERNGIYIIDLQQSLDYIDRAYEFIRETVAHGGTHLAHPGTTRDEPQPGSAAVRSSSTSWPVKPSWATPRSVLAEVKAGARADVVSRSQTAPSTSRSGRAPGA